MGTKNRIKVVEKIASAWKCFRHLRGKRLFRNEYFWKVSVNSTLGALKSWDISSSLSRYEALSEAFFYRGVNLVSSVPKVPLVLDFKDVTFFQH